MQTNTYQTFSEVLESMDYVMGHHNFMVKSALKYLLAAPYYFKFKNWGQNIDISDKRAALYEAAETWVDALNGREFRGGSKPNLADMAVFGILRPIRYMKYGKDMVEHTQLRLVSGTQEWKMLWESLPGLNSELNSFESRLQSCFWGLPPLVGREYLWVSIYLFCHNCLCASVNCKYV